MTFPSSLSNSYSQTMNNMTQCMTGAVDFRGRRPRSSKDGMPVEGVDFDKILALLPLKMLAFLLNKGFIRLLN